MAPTARLKKGRDTSLRRWHPWVFTGAIEKVTGEPAAGDSLDLVAADGTWLARGAWSPSSQIGVRVWTFDAEEQVDREFFRRRVERAFGRRGARLQEPKGAVRLVHGESDGLPGIVVDRFAKTVVVQLNTAGAERWRQEIFEAVKAVALGQGLDEVTLWERSDAEARSKEGLEPRVGLVSGPEPAEGLEIEEEGRLFSVDIRGGHKTGFYLDQRENRSLVAGLVAERSASGARPRVLDAFSYSGGFTVAALQGGAEHVTQIEASADALALGRRHLELNSLAAESVEQVAGNAFSELRRLRAEQRRFDLIILDPPKFADTKARVERAARGYKDINLLAFQLLNPGGQLVTFSCSGRLAASLFVKIVADAALDARREARILRRLGAGPDHPVSLAFPEGRYLKGLVCQAD